MNLGIVIRLSVMMFLQFFIWGAWYVTAPNYLGTIGFGPGDFAWTYSVGPIAGIITPLFVGMVADRFFPAQWVLGAMHLVGAALMYVATVLMQATTPDPNMINVVFFGYMLTYYPTLALTNTVAMRNMTDPESQFPYIRVSGTIGWIAAGLLLTALKYETTINMFYLTSGAALLLGAFSFLLPHTPPENKEAPTLGQLFGVDAFSLLKDRSYLVFIVSSMLICIPLAFYYQIASRVVEMTGLPIGQTMSYGQMSEIFFMLVMPFFFARLGVKWMLLVGMATWTLRYTLFAFGATEQNAMMIVIAVVVHGICYDFFFVTGQIYTDRKAPKPVRAQAQGLLVMLTLGLGMLIGAQTAGRIEAQHTTAESKAKAAEVKSLGEQIDALKSSGGSAEEIDTLAAQKAAARKAELQAIEWKPLWLKPAIFAAVVMVLFGLLFRDKVTSTESPLDHPPIESA
ncbi:MAG: MFS transporter [Planctomycetaceae bacterium]|nr:MFS transporter [Planctomycetaceae bacterium]